MDLLRRTGLGAQQEDKSPELREISLSRSRTYRFGRNADQEIRIVDDMISRQHAVLRYFNGTWHVEDKKALNKTYINGVELIPHQVRCDID